MLGSDHESSPLPVKWQKVRASAASLRMTNPIRALLDTLKRPEPVPGKELLDVSIGDPTEYNNFTPNTFVQEELKKVVTSNRQPYHGYVHATGSAEAKKAVAQAFTSKESPLQERDIVLTSGCSGALEMAIKVLCNPGDNILLPRPGFSLYQVLCEHLDIKYKYYDLLPEKEWEVDLDKMRSIIDDRTRAILVNSPSNPCGSVFSLEHMEEILQVAQHDQIPIISDEVYYEMVFPSSGKKFYSFGRVSKDVPVLVVGGIAKRYLVPGWRVGWVQIHDRNNVFEEVRQGLFKLATLILGPNTLVQGVLPQMLLHTPQQFYEENLRKLEINANLLIEELAPVQGLKVIKPSGAMYVMLQIEVDKFKDVKDDLEFAQKLLDEELVFVLPGSIFLLPNFVRLVICPTPEKLHELCDRLANFCKKHTRAE